MIVNLIGNAIKFTERAKWCWQWRRTARTTEQRRLLHFAVRDTGIGIPPEKQGLIFDASRRPMLRRRDSFGGTGLGLAISRRLVELMGGRIWVESEPGREHIPFHRAVRKSRVAGNGSSLGQAGKIAGETLLIVDDNESVAGHSRGDFQRLADHAGAGKRCGRGAGGAAARLRERSEFALVVADAQMPGKSGFELAGEIRRRFGNKAPKFVMLGSATKAERTSADREAGIDAFLSKPLQQSQLLDLLQDIFIRRRAGGARGGSPARGTRTEDGNAHSSGRGQRGEPAGRHASAAESGL